MAKSRHLTVAGWLAAASLLLLAGCSEGDNAGCPPTAVPGTPTAATQSYVWPGDDWEVSTPEAEGMDAARLEDVAAYCEEHGCRAVVIVRHGRIAWERYWGGWDKNSTDNSWSMAKSITSALVGITIAEGKIKSVDQSAADFIPEWRGTDKEQITLRDLLSMRSGLLWDEDYEKPSDVITMFGSDDDVGYAVSRPLYRTPGSDWYYSSGDTEIVSRILKAATGMEAREYAERKLFGPIGMKGVDWAVDKAGQTMTYCCAHTTARNFARFGYLFLRNGRWGNTQVVPEQWVRESTQPSQWQIPAWAGVSGNGDDRPQPSGDRPGYGYYWWLLNFPDAPKDMYMAMGIETKRIYVIPSLDIVAVRLGEGDKNWDDNAFLKPIVDATTGP
jgi:CubicO group peptidase (beta-lactamase class C family)